MYPSSYLVIRGTREGRGDIPWNVVNNCKERINMNKWSELIGINVNKNVVTRKIRSEIRSAR